MEEKASQKLGAFNVFLLNMHNEHMRVITPYCYSFQQTRRKRMKLWFIHQIFCRLCLPPHEFMRKIDSKYYPQFTYEAIKKEFERRQAVKAAKEKNHGK